MEIVLPVPSPELLRHAAWEWLRAHRVEIAIVGAITVFAAVLRLVNLSEIPPGLHGDEAIAGMEARALLDQGNLGHGNLDPYSFGARGVPAGTFYWAAFVIGLTSDSVTNVRLAYALLGIGSVVFTYLAFRVMFTQTIATIATLLLAVSVWHLHFSRIAFIPIGWPLMEMATMFFFFLALRYRSRWLFGAAGACLGGGIYTYQAFPTFAVGFAVAIVAIGALEYRGKLLDYTSYIGALLGVALFVGMPMTLFAWDNPSFYTSRYEQYSVTNTDEYKDAGNIFAKAGVLIDREIDYVDSVISDTPADSVDGAGVIPFVDGLSVVLIVVGGGMAAWRWREGRYATVLIVIAAIAAGPALAEEGWYRRTLGLVPLLALLAALPLAWVWEEARKRGPRASIAAGLAVVAVIGSVAGINLGRYFTTFDDHGGVRWVYAADLAEAAEFAASLPEGTYVLFYNPRHSFEYETRVYIAPGLDGEDRSREFGGTASLRADRSRDLVYVFFGPYANLLPDVKRMYPGGTEYLALRPGDVEEGFAAYVLPNDPDAPPPPPELPTPTVPPAEGGDLRDVTRLNDLASLQAALEAHREEEGSYPDTGGAIQSLCVFEGLDAGCVLADVLGPLPADPLGDPAMNGYFYVSDGERYTLYANRESNVFPACEEHPEHLGSLPSVYCATGPP